MARSGTIDARKQYPDGSWRHGYSPERAEYILQYLAAGASIRQGLQKMKEEWGEAPCPESVAMWGALDIDGWCRRVTEVGFAAAEAHADRMLDVIEGVLKKPDDPEYVDPKAARVALNGMQWVASKLKPDRFGEKVEHTLNASPDYVKALEALDRKREVPGDRAKVIEHE